MSDSLFDLSKSISKELEEILSPMFNTYGVDYFSYTIYLPKQKKACFLSNKPYAVKRMQEIGAFSREHDDVLSTLKIGELGIFIWPKAPDELNHIGCMLKEEGVEVGTSFLIRQEDESVKNIGFGSSRDGEKFVNIFLNNSEIFEHFVAYFEANMKDTLKTLKEKFVPFNMAIKKSILDSTVRNAQKCIESLQMKRIEVYHYNSHKPPFYLTHREFECLFFLCKGRSIKQIALELNLSPRTVESYISVCKSKFQVFNKYDLITKVQESNLARFKHLVVENALQV